MESWRSFKAILIPSKKKTLYDDIGKHLNFKAKTYEVYLYVIIAYN